MMVAMWIDPRSSINVFLRRAHRSKWNSVDRPSLIQQRVTAQSHRAETCVPLMRGMTTLVFMLPRQIAHP